MKIYKPSYELRRADSNWERAAGCMFLIMLMLFVCILRMITISEDTQYSEAADKQTSYRLTAGRQRGTVFDTNMKSLTNSETRFVAAVESYAAAKKYLSPYLTDEAMNDLEKQLSGGLPVLVSVPQEINGDGITSIAVHVPENSETLSKHLIGYVDGSGHGVSGIEAAFDSLLYSEENAGVSFSIDGKGNILSKFGSATTGSESVTASGVKITIDADIQRIVEAASSSLISGAVVVSEVGTGKIRAAISYPQFDPSNVAKSLDDEASPLLNRVFCAYNVGSVFKPCVAAAALEQGIYAGMSYECTGGKVIGGKLFKCHKSDGHGMVTLQDALAFSCNTYFYTLAIKTGARSVYNMASSLGFGQRYVFSDGLCTAQGNLTALDILEKSDLSLANLAIGQGDLMLTPVSLLTLYEAVANGGEYHAPTLIEGIVKNGIVTKSYTQSAPTRVMTKENADHIKQGLIDVINRGTGANAAPLYCTAGGKTATAQTGWQSDKGDVDHSWFCGFFPADDPRYIAVIISENKSGGGAACGPVFAGIADGVYTLKLS